MLWVTRPATCVSLAKIRDKHTEAANHLKSRHFEFEILSPSRNQTAHLHQEPVESIDAESVKASNVPVLAILDWMSAAITEAEDAAAATAAAEAAAIAAAEQAAADAAEAAQAAAAAAEEAGEGEGDE